MFGIFNAVIRTASRTERWNTPSHFSERRPKHETGSTQWKLRPGESWTDRR